VPAAAQHEKPALLAKANKKRKPALLAKANKKRKPALLAKGGRDFVLIDRSAYWQEGSLAMRL
jgi:hypothetical protein